MSTPSRAFQAAALVLVAAALASCKATEAPDSGFLRSPERMQPDPTAPFHRVWYEKNADWDGFKEIHIAPVHTGYLLEASWWDDLSFAGDAGKDAAAIAGYLHDRVRDALRKDPKKRLRVVETPGPGTLVLELALVELTPTKAWLNTLSYVGLQMALDYGSVAIEGRLRAGPGGKVVAMFKDREKGKMALVSVADLTWYSHAYHIIDDWAAQLVAIANAEEDERVADTLPVTLKPW